jgi:hypothetical protein
MTSLEGAVRAALLEALRADAGPLAGLNRVGEGEGRASPVPWCRIGEIAGTSWGAKERPGREVRATILIGDRGEAERTAALAGAAEEALAVLPRTLAGWETGGVQIVRTRMAVARDGLRTAQIELRVRGWRAD